jgi:pimeloyl-ACP methyl ester carboxylesterase
MTGDALRLNSCVPGMLAIAAIALLVVPAVAQQETVPPLVIKEQGSFFVGGRDLKSETLSTSPRYAPVGTVTVDQMYVRYQVPAEAGKRRPLTLVHGCCLTGKTWETTPDGRMGWDDYLIRKGHPVYVVDQVHRGRSAANVATINSVKLGKTAPDQLPNVFAAGREAAWAIFRFGPEYPKTFPGMRFPLAAQGELWKQMVPDWIESLPTPNPTVPALSQLAIRLNGTVLIHHSASGIYAFQTAALSPQGIAGMVVVEGICPPADRDVTPYTKMPILLLWGDYVELAPRWAPRLKACRDFVAAVNKAGGKAELVVLPELGIKGNSHMLMHDDNSLALADLVLAWIAKNVE